MDTIITKISLELNFAQIGWVVKDIKAAVRFFKDTMGINNFGKVGTIRAQDLKVLIMENHLMMKPRLLGLIQVEFSVN